MRVGTRNWSNSQSVTPGIASLGLGMYASNQRLITEHGQQGGEGSNITQPYGA